MLAAHRAKLFHSDGPHGHRRKHSRPAQLRNCVSLYSVPPQTPRGKTILGGLQFFAKTPPKLWSALRLPYRQKPTRNENGACLGLEQKSNHLRDPIDGRSRLVRGSSNFKSAIAVKRCQPLTICSTAAPITRRAQTEKNQRDVWDDMALVNVKDQVEPTPRERACAAIGSHSNKSEIELKSSGKRSQTQHGLTAPVRKEL